MDKFFSIGPNPDAFEEGFATFERCNSYEWSRSRCDQCDRTTGSLLYQSNLRVIVRCCDEPVDLDLCIYPHVDQFVLPEDVRALFDENGITGASYSKVDIDYFSGPGREYGPEEYPYTFYHLDVIGRGGVLPLEAYPESIREKVRLCDTCRIILNYNEVTEKRRTIFSLSEWDGSDCFDVRGIGCVYSKKVIDVLSDNGIDNWTAEPVDSIE